MELEGKRFSGANIMSVAEQAAAEYGCSVDDLDYELLTDEENEEPIDEENPVTIIVYGVLESAAPKQSEERASMPRRDPATLTEEEFDHVADVTADTIREILHYFDADSAEIDEYEGDEGEIILDVVGDNLSPLIGRHGRTLDALQFLVSSIVCRKLGFRIPVTVDVEGYKNRRREKIEAMAESSAARAIRQHGEVHLRPMSAYERRIVHIALKDNDKVETFSEGVDPGRYVVIRAL